jgi:hypothetical protein
VTSRPGYSRSPIAATQPEQGGWHSRQLQRSNRYRLTDDGIRIAIFHTKVYNRLLIPLTAADQLQAPSDLRAALSTIDRHVGDYITRARLPQAA